MLTKSQSIALYISPYDVGHMDIKNLIIFRNNLSIYNILKEASILSVF